MRLKGRRNTETARDAVLCVWAKDVRCCHLPDIAVQRVSVDIYFCEDLSGGHSLCLNEEKKFSSEIENTFFFLNANIQENLTLLYPQELS